MESVRQQIAAMRQSFFDEEILDKQFYQLERLEKKGNPNFVEEVLTIYFRESTALLQTIEQAMETEPIEPVKIDRMLYKLKGSSASIGANKVRNKITKTRQLVEGGKLEEAKAAFRELRNEHGNLMAKLELYFQQLCPVETASRPVPGEAVVDAGAGDDHRS
ncbi:HPT phosphotransmitter 4 [Hibiscus trionum]|uniref:Histidine-containing phosphotransfer protein n=1 Tax=Hibiscus trionum TaxID=183268 RepID=A0A9W7JGX4_HIBTR|nr:HPT phosphotransmitter 4 [Hibiscus trionum]